MSKEHVEYDRDVNPYPCSGKKYNGEKAIISLTSWKDRINTVAKTVFSLIKQCPGFHIVLVLSEEEFTQKEDALPEELMLFVDNELIELLWVYKNYKSFKKVLFTMDKYRDVPIISADDDCIYTCNYAQMLYDEWLKDKSYFITVDAFNKTNRNKFYANKNVPMRGPASLFYGNSFALTAINLLSAKIQATHQDDAYYDFLINKLHLRSKRIRKTLSDILVFHDETNPLRNLYDGNKKV